MIGLDPMAPRPQRGFIRPEDKAAAKKTPKKSNLAGAVKPIDASGIGEWNFSTS
jgi:hypothetical protein